MLDALSDQRAAVLERMEMTPQGRIAERLRRQSGRSLAYRSHDQRSSSCYPIVAENEGDVGQLTRNGEKQTRACRVELFVSPQTLSYVRVKVQIGECSKNAATMLYVAISNSKRRFDRVNLEKFKSEQVVLLSLEIPSTNSNHHQRTGEVAFFQLLPQLQVESFGVDAITIEV
jgi:hypothetical protein